MSLEAEKSKRISEITAGVHLVTILSMKRLLDSNKNQVIKDGEMAIIITFATGDNRRHEQVYYLGKGNEGRERYFTSMCLDAGVDMSKTPLEKKDVIGKRLWIAIKEVFTLINGGEDVLKDITGAEVIEYFVFQTAPVFDPERAPTWKGDPAKNDGNAMDLFVGYKDEGSGYEFGEENTLQVEQAAGIIVEERKIDAMPNFDVPTIQTIPTIETKTEPNFGDTEFPDDKF